MQGKRWTLADVAAAAGVSKMTASRALRGAADVSVANVEKVRQAAEDIGYVGNPLASSLSGQRSGLVGVIIPSMANIVFAEVLAGIADGIEGSGLQPVFGVTDYDPKKEYDAIRNMLSWNPSGLIVTGLDQTDETRLMLENADIPVVQIMDLDGTPVDVCIGFSHHAAGETMGETLVRQGRRHFGYVGCGLDRDTRAMKRLRGFEAGLTRTGMEFVSKQTQDGPSTTAAGRTLTARILAESPELDCIYYSNDDVAAGGVYHCLARGIAVPEKILLAGFNGLEFIDSLPVRIATSRTPRREIGRAAALTVLDASRIGGRRARGTIKFTPELDLGT